MTGGVGVELLGAGVAVVDGLAGDPCGVAGQILHQNVLLAAVAAADTLLDDVDLIFRNAAHPADDAAHMVRHLRSAVEYQTPALDMRVADMRLERRVLDLAGLVGALHDSVRLGEALFHIADAAFVGRRDILVDVRAQRELVDDLALALVARELIVLREIRGRARVVDDLAVVDERRALRHGLLDRVDRALRLILDLDKRGGLIGDLRRAGDDARDAVANMADLQIEEPTVVRGRLGVALAGLHIVRFRRIVGGENGGDAGQLLRLARVDGLDVSAGKGAAENMQAPCVLRHLVLHEDRLAGDQRRAVDLAAGLTDDLKVGTEGRRDLAAEFAEVAQLNGKLDGEVVMLIARVADKDASEYILDLFTGGVGLLLEKPCQDQRGGRRVVRALHDARGDHGLLHIVQLTPVQQALGSTDLRALSLIEENEVRILELAVKDNGIAAGEALGVVAVADAAVTGMVQDITKPCGGFGAKDDLFAVDSAFQFHRCYLPSVKTMPARYFLYAALPVRSST